MNPSYPVAVVPACTWLQVLSNRMLGGFIRTQIDVKIQKTMPFQLWENCTEIRAMLFSQLSQIFQIAG